MACDVDPVEPPEGVPVFKKVVRVSEGGGDGEGAIGDPGGGEGPVHGVLLVVAKA